MIMMNGGFAMMPVIPTPHGMIPVMMPYQMPPSGPPPGGPVPPMYDPRMANMPLHNGFSNTSSAASRSPFASSSSGSSSYTNSSIHTQFIGNKSNLSFSPLGAAESSGEEDDHIP